MVVRFLLLLLAWLGTLPGAGAAPREIAGDMTAQYSAAFVSQTVPSTVEIGVLTSLSVTMRNTGSATWRVANGDVFLATQRPQDNYYWCIQGNAYGSRSGNRVLLPRDVGPGEDVTFAFDVKPLGCVFAAPSPLRFRMLSQAFGTFGDETPDPGTAVTTAAEFVRQQVPAKVPASAKVQVTVTFRNTTPVAWQPADGYALASAGPAGNATWTVKSVPLSAVVAPGATVTFTFLATAPAVTGSYNFQWQVTNPAGMPFGQVTQATTVAVVAAGPANYQGLWWASPAASEAGWGLNVAHQDDVIFMTWFTYDAAGKPWWLTMTANRTASQVFSGALLEQTGPAFDAVPFAPSKVRGRSVGTGTLTFTSIDNGTFDYTVDAVRQTKAITRQVFGPVPTCTFALVNDLATAYNYQDLWWAAPGGTEAGWGINFTHQGDVIFATWFTYALDGSPTWVSATLAKSADGVYQGDLRRTTGPPLDAVPFDPRQVTNTAVGSATVTFTDGNNGTFAYTLDGIQQEKTITRQVFRTPGTVCQ